jgi:uncharacterized protein YodC (DUF2158 family)
MEQKFKIGDIVVLKSGSPPMTIIDDRLGDDPRHSYFFDGTYRCAWFNETNEFREIISQDALRLYSKSNKGNPQS